MVLPSWLNQALEGSIDFEGQRKAENWSQFIILASLVMSFLYGFYAQSVNSMLIGYVCGCIAAYLLTIPPWSIYNQNPVTWLPAVKEKPGKSD